MVALFKVTGAENVMLKNKSNNMVIFLMSPPEYTYPLEFTMIIVLNKSRY